MSFLKKHLKKILLTLWIVAIGCTAYYLFTHNITPESLQASLKDMGLIAGLIYIIAYALRPLIFFPTSIMTPLAAILFGPYLGWIFAYIGESFSAAVAFFAGRYFGRSFVENHENEFLKKYDKKLSENGFETILFLRFVPLFPFDFVNYSGGLSGITFKDYILGTMLGIIPGLTAYIFLGGAIMNPWLIIPTILSFLLLTLIARTWKKRQEKIQK
jgi:uncharacterized membrane protein YdjX (TVP38/TMEM64 family)